MLDTAANSGPLSFETCVHLKSKLMTYLYRETVLRKAWIVRIREYSSWSKISRVFFCSNSKIIFVKNYYKILCCNYTRGYWQLELNLPIRYLNICILSRMLNRGETTRANIAESVLSKSVRQWAVPGSADPSAPGPFHCAREFVQVYKFWCYYWGLRLLTRPSGPRGGPFELLFPPLSPLAPSCSRLSFLTPVSFFSVSPPSHPPSISSFASSPRVLCFSAGYATSPLSCLFFLTSSSVC